MTRTCSISPGSARPRCARPCGRRRQRSRASPRRRRGSSASRSGRNRTLRSASMRACSAPSAAQTDVKRDMEITRDEVRVMTVHGAKGLEAPIVVLADTITPPAGPGQRQPRLLDLAGSIPDRPTQFVWAGRKALDVAPVSAARARMQADNTDEYRRLLYVAMTRASERLIVC